MNSDAAPKTPPIAAANAPLSAAASPRLVSLDAYRGFIMLAMAGEGFGFPQVAKQFPDSGVWHFLGYQFSHTPWVSCSFWDLIQPAFMFMVGLSMAYSYASRAAKGESYGRMLWHAVTRAAILILLGIFLYSENRPQTNFVFKNVLTQIGLGYVFLFLLWNRPLWVQAVAAVAILFGDWLMFAMYPAPDAAFDFSEFGVPADWPHHLSGFAAHFDKNTNAAAAFDRWFLNLFPRPEPFVFDKEGYCTLNFIPSLATMIFGLMTGELLRGTRSTQSKMLAMIGWGVAGIAVGLLLDVTGVCPIVKRTWTSSFTLYSTGWVLFMLAAFYVVVDVGGYKRWTWPLVIVGMNSIAVYVVASLLRPWIGRTLQTHFGARLFDVFSHDYSPIAESVLILAAIWMMAWWMYRQKIFVRI
jgi:heparan-alpha-glucosaminide N-acetyltransferase